MKARIRLASAGVLAIMVLVGLSYYYTHRNVTKDRANMKTTIINALEQGEEFFAEENIYGRILSDTRNATAVLARIKAGEAQTHHFQHRPNEGDEVIFFFAGVFEVRMRGTVRGPLTATPSNPIFIYVQSGDELSIRNLDRTDLVFFTVLAPGYKEGEITFLK